MIFITIFPGLHPKEFFFCIFLLQIDNYDDILGRNVGPCQKYMMEVFYTVLNALLIPARVFIANFMFC